MSDSNIQPSQNSADGTTPELADPKAQAMFRINQAKAYILLETTRINLERMFLIDP